jgi:hypothetical protein
LLNGNNVGIDTSRYRILVDVRDELFLKFNQEQPETIVLPQQLRLVKGGEDGNKISVIKTDLNALLCDAMKCDIETKEMSFAMRKLVNALISKLAVES